LTWSTSQENVPVLRTLRMGWAVYYPNLRVGAISCRASGPKYNKPIPTG
jgi:hypothetical protein